MCFVSSSFVLSRLEGKCGVIDHFCGHFASKNALYEIRGGKIPTIQMDEESCSMKGM